MIRKIKISLLIVFSTIFLSACSFSFPWEKPRVTDKQPDLAANQEMATSSPVNLVSTWTNDLRRFATEEGLKGFLSQTPSASGATVSGLTVESNYGLGSDVVSLSPADWQVLGFSQPDIVKTDNNYVYALVKNNLHIISISPVSEAKIVQTINFASRPLEILINGSSLIVIGQDTEINTSALYRTFKRDNIYTFVNIFNISTPTNPLLVRRLSFEGSYIGARLSDSYLYFAAVSPAYYQEGEQILPRVIEGDEIINISSCVEDSDCALSNVYYFDAPYKNYTFLSTATINTTSKSEPLNIQSFIVDSNYSYSFSNSGNFYLMRTESLSTDDLEQEIKRDKMLSRLNTVSQDRIKEIESSPAFVLRSGEKQIKIAAIIDNYLESLSKEERDSLQLEVDEAFLSKVKQRSKEIDQTNLYRFNLKAGKIEYQAKGTIAGRVIKKGSLDEKNGHLRIVTTRSQVWSLLFDDNEKFYSNVYILDNKLNILGALENIATEAAVYSSFFMGDRVYIMTSDVLAPMYAVNLSDVNKPAILGGIKIPRYVHVYPADSLGVKFFGLGRENLENTTSEALGNQALRVSLFDFTDLEQPKELSSYDIVDSTSDSIAFSDYKSLSFFIPQDKVSLPLTLKDESGQLGFAGTAILAVEGETLKLKGQIDHSDNGRVAQSDIWRGLYYDDSTVKRSFIVNDNLFTLSNKYLKINDLNTLDMIAAVKLLSSNESYGDVSNDYSIIDNMNNEMPIIPDNADINADLPTPGL